MDIRVAVLVDAAFYLKRANIIFGWKTGQERAEELVTYCNRHIKRNANVSEYLYRIFVYDCPPSAKEVYHPLLRKSIRLERTDMFRWSNEFHAALISKRKVALRMGELQENTAGFFLRHEAVKKLCRKDITVDDLTENDFYLDIAQKGVDMRIGLDIASLAHKKQVDQIVLIAGDSDFVPAAKHARREGIDFILDPMWQAVRPSLYEHIDGLKSQVQNIPENINDPLYKAQANQ